MKPSAPSSPALRTAPSPQPKPHLPAGQWLRAGLTACLLAVATSAAASARQTLHGHVPAASAALQPVERLAATRHLNLAIGLPLRNPDKLKTLLQDLVDPASPNFRQYLSPAQFTEQFGPTESDYQALVDFAKSHGLAVTVTHPNRLVLDVEGAISDVEKAFGVTMQVYQHPLEARTFFAPTAEPSLDLSVPVLQISGLDNYSLPHSHLKPRPPALTPMATPRAGAGPSGAYAGGDFRAAYVPGTALTGTGQSVALLQFDAYYASDIAAYRTQFGLPNVPLVNVAVDGGVPTPGSGNGEVCLDIEMAMAMAPGLAAIYVYEAPNSSPWVDLLNRMATDNLAKQISCSWGGGNPSASAEAIFQQMAAQGQSFFNATGDSDAFTGSISFPSDSPNITQVGATTLTTSGAGGAYVSETVWNWGLQSGSYVGSSGGSSTYYAIPSWQQGTSMATNQGSTTKRNVPDVALVGDNVYVRYNNGGSGNFGGTSCAAPLWAGFTALLNQQAAANGLASVGFLNPAIYALGNGASYKSCFHDTTSGNNFTSSSPAKFSAVAGFDLCTGWGSPAGSVLINALAGAPDPLLVTTGGFAASGHLGGPFTPAAVSYTLTNGGSSAVTWSAGKTQTWTTLSASSGSLAAGANVTLTWSLNSGASSLGVGTYADTLTVTNTGSGVVQTRALSLAITGPPGITTASPLPSGTVGTAYSQTLAASGGTTPYSWSLAAGALPAGVNLSNGGVLSGTPSAAGVAGFTVQVTGNDGQFSSKGFSLTIVLPPPSITSASPLPTGTVGMPYSQTLAASGGTSPYTWSISAGALPSGLSLSSGGVLSGTPAAATSASFTLKVSGSNGLFSTKACTLSISPYFGIPFTEGFENAGAIPAYWTQEYVTSTVNWAFQAGGHSSHPSSAHGGSYNALLYSGSTSNHITKLVTPMIIFGANATNAQLTFWHYMQLWSPDQDQLKIYYQTSAGGAWTLLASFASNVASWTQQTVALPNPNSSYYIAFEGNAKYGYGVCIDDVRITSAAAPSITTNSPLPAGTAGAAYSQSLATSGGTAPFTWSLAAGSLPPGLSLGSGGLLSGTPSAAVLASFTVQVAGADGSSSTKAFSLTVNPALAASPARLPAATAGSAYTHAIAVSGGTAPYTTLAVSGFDGDTTGLTAGALSVNPALATVTLSGTPAATGKASFTLNVTDTAGANLAMVYSVTVNPAISITHTVTPAGLPAGTVGIAYLQTVSVSGGTTPYTTFAVSGFSGGTTGLAPASITLDPLLGTLTISGTPAASGTASFTLNVTDSAGATLAGVYSITINPGYAAWASGFGLSGADALPGAMPFGDGVTNLLKYAFNMNGGGPDGQILVPASGTAGLPSVAQNGSGTQGLLHLEFLRRKSSGLIYTPLQSTLLAVDSWVPVTATATVTDVDAEWERVAIDAPSDATAIPASFLTVEVELP